MKQSLFVSATLLAAACAHAQTAAGPVLGWTLEQDGRAVRTIFGVPGASRLSPAAALPGNLRVLRLSPDSSWSVAQPSDNALPVLYNVATGDTQALDSTRANAASAFWSPSGAAFAIAYHDPDWIQIFTRQDGAYQLTAEFAASGRIAVADTGHATLVETSDGLLLRRDDQLTTLTTQPAADFTFLAGTEIPAYIAGVLTIGDVQTTFTAEQDQPVRLASPRAGIVMMIRSGRITTLNPAGDILADERCACETASIETLGRSGAVRIASPTAEGPLWLIDSAAQQRVFFVPAAIPAEDAALEGGR